VAHAELGDNQRALEGLRAVLQRMRARERPQWEIGHCLTEIGYLLLNDGRLDDAEAAMREGLALQEAEPGYDLYLAAARNGLGQVLYDRGDTSGALACFEQTLALRQQVFPHGHPLIPSSHYNIAECHKLLGDLAEAETRYAAALQEGERINGPEHPSIAAFLLGHSEILQLRGDLTAAEPLLLRALAIRERSLPEGHPTIAWTLNDLGTLRMRQGRWAEAVTNLERAVAIYRAARPNHLSYAIALDNLGRTYEILGQRPRAREAFDAALETSIRWAGPAGEPAHKARQRLLHHLTAAGAQDAAQALAEEIRRHAEGADREWWIGQAEASLALLHAQRGDAAAAQAQIEAALPRLRGARPEETLELANAIAMRGWVHLLQQQPELAEARCRDAVAMFDRILPAGHEDLGYPLNMLGTLVLQRDLEAALPILQRASELRGRLLPADHHWRLVSEHNYATVLHRLGRSAEARPLVEQAIELRRRHATPSAVDLFAGHVLATSVARALDDPEAALQHAAAAHELARRVFAAQPWHVARAANALAELQWSLGRAEDAAVTLTDAEEFVAKLPEQHAERREAVRIRGLLAGR
jgi:tetratricopeptide (TPR) repeat protein